MSDNIDQAFLDASDPNLIHDAYAMLSKRTPQKVPRYPRVVNPHARQEIDEMNRRLRELQHQEIKAQVVRNEGTLGESVLDADLGPHQPVYPLPYPATGTQRPSYAATGAQYQPYAATGAQYPPYYPIRPPQIPLPSIYSANPESTIPTQQQMDNLAKQKHSEDSVIGGIAEWMNFSGGGKRRTKRRKNKKRKTAKRSRKAKRGKSKRR